MKNWKTESCKPTVKVFWVYAKDYSKKFRWGHNIIEYSLLPGTIVLNS